MSTEPELLALTDAEMVVVLAAMDESLEPFLTTSNLLELNQDELKTRLVAARAKLLAHDIVFGSAAGGPIGVDPAVGTALKRIPQMQVAFELMQATRGQPPNRLRFVVDERGVLAYRLSFMDSADSDANQFWALPSVQAATQWATRTLQLPQVEQPATEKTFLIPHVVMSALAAPATTAHNDLAALLRTTGMSDEEAASFMAAGLNPVAQGTFTRLAQKADKVQAGAILWFFDAATGWLISNFNENGNVVLVRATANDLKAALNSLMQKEP